MNLTQLRQEYERPALHRNELAPDPIVQFRHWFDNACQTNLPEPNAMILATADRTGFSATRTVLLKYFDENGFVFFTNYQSRKARHLADNPQVSLLFPWIALQRQVVVDGTAEKTDREPSETYFRSRPRGSQIGAWASPQSDVVASRSQLESKWNEIDEKFAGEPIPLPPFWGGYVVKPLKIEFWQGGKNRIHDRFRYSRTGNGDWIIDRLAP